MATRIHIQGEMAEEPDMGDLDLDELSPGDRARIENAMEAFGQAASDPTPSNWVTAGNASLESYNERSSAMPPGFEKFCIANIGWSGSQLDDDERISEAFPFVEFAMKEIKQRGWGPNGNATPLGRMYTALVGMYGYAQVMRDQPQPKRRGIFGRR